MNEDWNAPEAASPGGRPPGRNPARVWLGFGLLIVLHLIWILYVPAYIFIGIVQLLYAIPLGVWFYFKDRSMLQGVLLGVLVTFLLNAACFGIVLYQFNA